GAVEVMSGGVTTPSASSRLHAHSQPPDRMTAATATHSAPRSPASIRRGLSTRLASIRRSTCTNQDRERRPGHLFPDVGAGQSDRRACIERSGATRHYFVGATGAAVPCRLRASFTGTYFRAFPVHRNASVAGGFFRHPTGSCSQSPHFGVKIRVPSSSRV